MEGTARERSAAHALLNKKNNPTNIKQVLWLVESVGETSWSCVCAPSPLFVFYACVCLCVHASPTFQILIHPGVVMDDIRVVEAASSGGPLGELVQWSDLIATLYILGHHLHLSASISEVKM